MTDYKKTIIGSLFTFVIGTSCCWISAVAIWGGGATFIGAVVQFIEDIQTQLIILSVVLGIISIYLYRKRKKIN